MQLIRIALACVLAMFAVACTSLGGSKFEKVYVGSVKIANPIDGIIVVIRDKECKVPYNTEAATIAKDIKKCLIDSGNLPPMTFPVGNPPVIITADTSILNAALTLESQDLAELVLKKIAE